MPIPISTETCASAAVANPTPGAAATTNGTIFFTFVLLARPTKVANFACLACYEFNVSKKTMHRCSHLLQIAIGGNRSECAPARRRRDALCNGLRTKGLPAIEQARIRCLAGLSASGSHLSVIFDYKLASILTAQMKNARCNRTGHFLPMSRRYFFSLPLHK